MTEDQIKYMVDRFLGWKLPEAFNPDNGISFEPIAGKDGPYPFQREPSGTNLFDATQADAMVRAMINGMPSNSDFRWLIEAPGPRYLAVQRLSGSDNFEWTTDHNRALAFRTKEQADGLMAALRLMDRALTAKINHGKLSWGDLFAFEPKLGNAKAVEHGWIALTDETSKPDAWDAARGCAPGATGDLSSEDFVRKMRDEEWS